MRRAASLPAFMCAMASIETVGFTPDLVLISAGFDSMAGDPLGGFTLEYEHFEALGGFRKAAPDSMNTGWRSAGFRGYADYMATPEFGTAVERLISLAAAKRTAIMCAEAVPWKCHRSLLSDSLVARGVLVIHILSGGKTQAHRLTPFAHVHAAQVTYPGARKAV